jgi:fluoride exporter
MTPVLNSLWIGCGAVLGALLRYFIAAQFSTSPVLGIASINIAGSFILGIIWQFNQNHPLSSSLNLLLAIGFLGSFTTFSTFSKDNFELWQQSRWLAAGNMFGQVVLGLLFFYLGVLLSKYYWSN